MRTLCLLAPLLATISGLATAQTCDVLADINQQQIPLSGLGQFGTNTAECAGVTYFAAFTVANGLELWSTTGTAASTHLVADIAPGAEGSKPTDLFCHAGTLFFMADDGVHGRELWRSDGTALGTQLVKDIGGDLVSFATPGFLSFGGELYFNARSDNSGSEVWHTDGTEAGTSILKDIRPGAASSSAFGFTVDRAGTGFYFRADNGAVGSELWWSDGTTAGTHLLADINFGPGSSQPSSFVVLSNTTLFTAFTPALGAELYKTDGTAPGTVLVADIMPGVESSLTGVETPVKLGGRAYFRAFGGGSGTELWRSDGTTLGTSIVSDLAPGAASGNPKGITPLGGKLYFSAFKTGPIGIELYTYDPVADAVALVKDINSNGSSNPAGITAIGGQLYFRAAQNGLGDEPWTTNGTAFGTVSLGDIAPGAAGSSPSGFVAVASGGVVFAASDPALGYELFKTPGGITMASLLVDIEPAMRTLDANPTELTVVSGSTLYFGAEDGVTGNEPYRWDPIGGAVLLKDIFVDPLSSNEDSDPEGFTQIWLGDHELVFFSAKSDNEGREPWVTDGTPAGTHLLKNIASSWSSSYPKDFIPAFGKVFFSADDGSDRELWVSDGTPAGTNEFKDLAIGSFVGSDPGDFVLLGDLLLFRASDAFGDTELWSSDGTPAGTNLLVNIGAFHSSSPRDLTRVGNQVAFTVDLPFLGTALYKTDGTVSGTKMISKLGTIGTSGPTGEFVTMDGELFFAGRGQFDGLWRSDLTASGTQEIANSGDFSPVGDLTPAYGRLFFEKGGELMVSDLTSAGTFTISAPPGGVGLTGPQWITAARNGVFYSPAFAVGTFTEDAELYFSNGTAAGTFMACNIGVGTSSSGFGPELPVDSNPSELVLLNGDLVFAASAPTSTGRELWRFTPAGAYALDLGISGNGHLIESTQPALGSTVTVSGTNAPSGQLSLLGLGFPIPAPSGAFTAPGSAGWLDPLSATLLIGTTTPTWSYSLHIVPSPALAGLQFVVQSWTPGSAAAFPATTSNGLLLVLSAE